MSAGPLDACFLRRYNDSRMRATLIMVGLMTASLVHGAIPAHMPLNVTTTGIDSAVRFYRLTVEEE